MLAGVLSTAVNRGEAFPIKVELNSAKAIARFGIAASNLDAERLDMVRVDAGADSGDSEKGVGCVEIGKAIRSGGPEEYAALRDSFRLCVLPPCAGCSPCMRSVGHTLFRGSSITMIFASL